MGLYLNFVNHDVASSAVCICCYLLVILNLAHIGTQDEHTISSSEFHHQHKESGENPSLKPEEMYKKFEIQYSLQSIWDIVNSPKFAGVPVVHKIRSMWETTKAPKIIQKKPRRRRKNATTTTLKPQDGSDDMDLFETTTHYETTTRVRLPGRQHPFVLVEGTLTTSRRKLVKGLMKHTSFVYVRNFRKTPFKYKDKFDSFKLKRDLLPLKRAFVSLQFYLTGRDIERILEDRPVIMSGYWMRQAAEYIARKHQDLRSLPGVGSDCYKWPQDLVRPDLVFFLHTPRTDNFTSQDTLKRIDRTVEIYHRMDPPVTVLDHSFNNLTDKRAAYLRKMMIEKLAPKFPYFEDFIKFKMQKGPPKKRLRKFKKHSNATIEGDSSKNSSLTG